MSPDAPVDRLHVLVVEDDRALRETLVEILEDDGHAVTAMDDGAPALEWLRTEHPDVVLLDMVMPRAALDGFGFLARLRDCTPEVQRIPLVLMSALGPPLIEALDPRTASLLNVLCVLAKPLKLSQVLSVARGARRYARSFSRA